MLGVVRGAHEHSLTPVLLDELEDYIVALGANLHSHYLPRATAFTRQLIGWHRLIVHAFAAGCLV